MKKLLYLLLALPLIFYSCSKDNNTPTAVAGCTDSTATNYNSLANTDDGSCIAYLYGCTDSTATNYNSLANTDDGSCTYSIIGEWDVISWIEVDGATTIDRFNTAGDPHTVTMTWAITSNGSLSVNAVDSWNYSYLETSTWTHIGDDFSMTDNNTGETQDFTISTLNKNNLVIFGTLDDGDGNMADHTISFTR